MDGRCWSRIFSRFEKLDVVFLAFLCFALIVEALRLSVNTPSPNITVGYRSRNQQNTLIPNDLTDPISSPEKAGGGGSAFS